MNLPNCLFKVTLHDGSSNTIKLVAAPDIQSVLDYFHTKFSTYGKQVLSVSMVAESLITINKEL